jgi:hypothetical protein
MQNTQEQKEKIFTILQNNGPSLPVRIASETKLPPLFASAFLSELYGERRIKISHMRVGSSPLYYLSGQEAMLENFIQHLNQRERDAFLLLKEKNILDDEKQEPVTRVALRAIRDFAIPLKIKADNNQKIFWRYHLLSESDAIKMIIVQKTPEKAPEKKIEERKEERDEKQRERERHAEKKEITGQVQISNAAKYYIEKKGLVLISVISEKRKEFYARVHSASMFGPQHYLLVAKDKKKFTQADISSVIETAQKERMPAIFLCQGSPDKKAQAMLNEWSNLIKFEKIEL